MQLDYHETDTYEVLMDHLSIQSANAPSKDACRNFYDSVNSYLDTTIFGPFAYFLNYGYLSDGTEEKSRVEVDRRELNLASLKLVLEVIGDCDLSNRSILDVSCGRGGSIDVARRFFRPVRAIGVDISQSAIDFDRRTHLGADVEFILADAEDLPFDKEIFDVVLNIEASHAYPNIPAFYSEVARVLVHGGFFLYADVLPTNMFGLSLDYMRDIGLAIQSNRNITQNVLLACELVARQRLQTFETGLTHDMSRFVGLPGSEIYERMRNGSSEYRILTFKKN